MDKDLENIKKLPPEQRIKALQELEKKNKEEIESIKKTIEESIEQIRRKDELEEEMQEIIPRQREVDITKLFKVKEESKIEEEAKRATKKESGKVLEQEIAYWSNKSIQDINERVTYFNQVKGEQGELTYQQQQEAKAIAYALDKKEEQYSTGPEQLEQQVYSTRKMLEQTLGAETVKYQRRGGFI